MITKYPIEYEQIQEQLKNSPSLKLLRSKKAAFIIYFFHKQFKENQRFSRKQSELISFLEDYLDFLREKASEEDYSLSPKDYLERWCNYELLRKTCEPGSDDLLLILLFNNFFKAPFTPEEYRLYVYLTQQQKRLEQERINQNYANEYLKKLFYFKKRL